MGDTQEFNYAGWREQMDARNEAISALRSTVATLTAQRDELLAREAMLRDALKSCRSHWAGYCITRDEQYKMLLEDFWKHIRQCDVVIDKALSSPTPALATLKAQHRAEALRDAAEVFELGACSGTNVRNFLRARAQQELEGKLRGSK